MVKVLKNRGSATAATDMYPKFKLGLMVMAMTMAMTIPNVLPPVVCSTYTYSYEYVPAHLLFTSNKFLDRENGNAPWVWSQKNVSAFFACFIAKV